jgi:hypothetical protein
MRMAGLPRSLYMTLSGHKTEGVFTRYSAIFTPKELQDAGAKLAAHHASTATESPSAVGLGHKIGTIDTADRQVSSL